MLWSGCVPGFRTIQKLREQKSRDILCFDLHIYFSCVVSILFYTVNQSMHKHINIISSSGSASATMIPHLSKQSDNTVLPEAQSSPVNGEAAETFIAEKRIGERIKYLRLKKSMGLVDLGRHTGLSASFLSQLETGRVVPTLRNLARIAMVFSKDLSYFFDPEPQTLFRVHRRGERMRLPQTGVENPSYFFESLGYLVPDRQLDPYFAEFLPTKDGKAPRPHQHAGCEFLYLLTGALDVQHGSATHHIEAGDAIYFDADTTHSYVCAGSAPATALIVTLQNLVMMPIGDGARVANAVNGRNVRNVPVPILQPGSGARKSVARMQ
jgi:transcriptional regulator with XRE-family HTH domain